MASMVEDNALPPCCWKHQQVLFLMVWRMVAAMEQYVAGNPFFFVFILFFLLL
jgi:hypothetical protein